jgi:glycosyltransferase involved in cell wall biosynthesis
MDRGVTVEVVCFEGKSMRGEVVHSLETHSSILYTHSKEPSFKDSMNLIFDIRRLNQYASELLSREDYDIVQIEDPVFAPFLSCGVPKVVTVHTTQMGEFQVLLGLLRSSRQLKRLVFSGTLGLLFDKLGLRDVEWVVTVGSTIRDELINYYKLPSERIVLVPNGVKVPDSLDKARAKEELGLDIKQVYIIYAGRLVDRKRVEDLLKAIYFLKREGHSISVVIMGEGPSRPSLMRAAESLGISSLVTFTGYVEDHVFFRFLEAADVFVLPSGYEGHPISLLEAMAYGCLPIASNIPQVHEIIRSGENGFTYPLGDVMQLKNTLKRVIGNRALRDSVTSKARKDVKLFSWSGVTDKYLEVYHETLKQL